MKHLSIVVALALLLLTACQPVHPVTDTTAAGASDTPIATQHLPSGVLALDPAVRSGVLENGFTYYIRHNEEPHQRAELWLAINAGSLLEQEDQLGLAHFLEHMLFNGTRRFEGQALIDFLESVGMEFGPDVNAYTSFDETVYTLQIPTDEPETIKTAFNVLEDWAGYASLTSEEIDKERGVIVEEWRQREQNASGRLREQIIPALLGDSQYSKRLPIGDMEIVRNAAREAFVRFYEQWYRPDLMALVVVGDVDVDQMEGLIQEHFSTLSTPTDPQPRPTFDVPEHSEPRYLIATDPEYPYTVVQVEHKRPAHPLQTVDDYRIRLVNHLIDTMLNQRLDELRRQADAPFLFAFTGDGNFVRPVDSYSVAAQVQDEQILTGLEALLTEVERAQRYGFTDSELARAQDDLLRVYENLYQDRNNRENSLLAQEYLNLFLAGTAAPGIETEYALAQELIPAITLEEVNTQAQTLVSAENRVALVIAPEKEGLTPPTAAELSAVFDTVLAKELEPYVDQTAGQTLLAEIPEVTPIVAEQTLPDLEATEIELANGVHVVMKTTDFKDDEILFAATSPGGSSVVADGDYLEAANVVQIITESGVGAFNQTELTKLLAGKLVSVSPTIGELHEGFTGSVAPADLETAFQLIYLYATQPRADEAAFAVFMEQQRAFLKNRELTPTSALQDALEEALCGESIRCRTPTLAEVEAFDFDRSMEIYRERFADMDDFTFLFVGNFEQARLQELAQRYLGALPTTPRTETWRDVAPDAPEGVIEKNAYKGQDEQSIVYLIFTGPIEPTPANRLQVKAVEGVMDILLREELREKLGGVYSPFVFSDVAQEPNQEYTIGVGFSCDPQRVDELVNAVFAQIADLQENGPSATNLEKVQEQQRRNLEENLEQNSYWLNQLTFYVEHPDADPHTLTEQQDAIHALTAADIQAMAQQILNNQRYVKAVLYPAAYKPE
ncbi:MAG: insulinase family protein [Caldilineaceae bacterium]